MFVLSVYDDCAAGGVCTSFRSPNGGAGICKQICDQQGSGAQCDDAHTCVNYSGLFEINDMNMAGVCNVSCNPLTDNDFDGSGSDLTR